MNALLRILAWTFAVALVVLPVVAVLNGWIAAERWPLRTLRDISDVLNNRSGIVVHETVADGSVYFGHDSQTTAADGRKTNDFNSDETIKFPSAVALIWRWTGDNRFRDDLLTTGAALTLSSAVRRFLAADEAGAHVLVPTVDSAGSTNVSLSATPQWRCGPVARPVMPTAPMRSPCSTTSPTFTSMRDRCRKLLLMPWPWSRTTVPPSAS